MEREEISRGLAAGEALRVIGARLGRSHVTISREITRNGGPQRYRAQAAELAAWERGRRPKTSKLASSALLRARVEASLGLEWSPQQISNRLRIEYPNDLGMRVSHETIYLSIFQSAREALAPNLHRRLRTGRTMRLPAIARQSQGRGRIRDMVPITDRPVEVESRTSAGDWEGDLVMGRRPSAVATLVERTTRLTRLVALPAGIKCGPVRQALTRDLAQVDPGLRRTLTWDRGREMAEHAQFTVDTGCQVYFCAPRKPWQRGSNENTNRLLRQYLPKTADLRAFSQQDLDVIADRLNHRPRAVLGWRTPAEAYRVALDEIVNQPDSAEVRSG